MNSFKQYRVMSDSNCVDEVLERESKRGAMLIQVLELANGRRELYFTAPVTQKENG